MHNGLTMCVGSYASRPDNDVLEMVDEFADRINFVHLRNVEKLEASGGFVEADHLGGDIDMYKVVKKMVEERERRKKKEKNKDTHGIKINDF
jgi:mannonate dehydratase